MQQRSLAASLELPRSGLQAEWSCDHRERDLSIAATVSRDAQRDTQSMRTSDSTEYTCLQMQRL